MRRAWPFHVLMCEIVRGRCHSCNNSLSREESTDTKKLFQDHRRHLGSVTVVGRVASPVEYRGIDLALTLEPLLPRSRQLIGGILHVPCLIFRLSCLQCDVQLFPATADDVLTFRKRHESHVQALRLYAIVQTASGHAVRKKLEACGSGELYSEHEVSELAKPKELRSLRRTITCSLVALKCTSCRSRTRFHRDSDIAELVGQHEGHLSYVYLKGHIDDPQEFVDVELNFLAHPFEWRSLQYELNIECFVFEMCHGSGKTSFVSLWHSVEIRQCLQMYSREPHVVRLRALVRGKNSELFELEFALSIRSMASALLEVEQQWLAAESR